MGDATGARLTDTARHLQARAVTLPGSWKVLVGRTDADNDYLSFRVARPEDWWFHVRGIPGSHVLLQGPPGADADRQTLTRAAAIAAYQTPPTPALRLCIIKPTGFLRLFREC